MNVSLEVCEARDPKGLYKLARAGKIKGIFFAVFVFFCDLSLSVKSQNDILSFEMFPQVLPGLMTLTSHH